MQSRNCKGLVFALAVGALLSWGGTHRAAATTLDLGAMFGAADCSLVAAADLTFLDMEPTTPAPNTPDDKQPKTCRINGNCWKPAYCAKEMGTCKGQGVCKAKPDSCTQEVDPVCACNHKTYNNACVAAQAGQNVIHKGKCEKKEH